LGGNRRSYIMKKYIPYIFLILFVFRDAFAANYYIAQSAAGEEDGTSCANAYAYDWNWSGVTAGDTVYMCGSFSSDVTVNASGSSGTGNEVTLKSCADGEANCGTGNAAAFSATYWTTSSPAIECLSKNYVIIDGNDVGTIEATDNGDSSIKNNSQNGYGIHVSGGSNVEVMGWTVEDIYVQPYNVTPDPMGKDGPSTVCIFIDASDDVYIHDNTVHDAGTCILYRNTTGTHGNIYLYDNTVSGCNWGICAIAGGGSTVMENTRIYNNDIEIGVNWITPGGTYHLNGSYDYVVSGAEIDGLWFYNNYVHGPSNPPGSWTCTGFFWQGAGNVHGVKAFNNLMVGVSGDPANFYLSANGHDAIAVNNTIIGYDNTDTATGIKVQGCDTGDDPCPVMKNNISVDARYGIWVNNTDENDANVTDFNNVFDAGTQVIYQDSVGNNFYTLSQWQSAAGGCPGTGHDCSSLTSNPQLDGNYRLNSGSPAISAGENLTSLGITELNSDKSGATRPSVGDWDIGAYEYVAGSSIIRTGGTFTGNMR
jgi:hypothetical protein